MSRSSRQSTLDCSTVKNLRRNLGKNQRDFWTQFGVSQPAGSRYENDVLPSVPLSILIWLHAEQKIQECDLAEARMVLGLN